MLVGKVRVRGQVHKFFFVRFILCFAAIHC